MQIEVQLWAKRLMTRMAWFRLAFSNTKTYARFKHLARSVLVVTKNILSAWNLPMDTWKCYIQVKIFNSHGLIIEELHFASHLFIVFSSFGGSLGSVVRYCHLPPRSRCSVDLHLHDAHAFAHSWGIALEREDPRVVVIINGHRGSVSVSQSSFGRSVAGPYNAVAWRHRIGVEDRDLGTVDNTRVAEIYVEMLIFFEYVIVNHANCQLLHRLTRFKDQSALGEFIVWSCVSGAILRAIVNLDTGTVCTVTQLKCWGSNAIFVYSEEVQ